MSNGMNEKMTFTDDDLSAFLDGELAPERASELRDVLTSDPDLAARLEELAAADHLVKATYGPIADEPMPDAVMEMLRADRQTTPELPANVTALTQKRGGVWRWSTSLAAAASLVLGIGVGTQLSTTDNDVDQDQLLVGLVAPASVLHTTLETGASAKPVALSGNADATVTPLLTFTSTDGKYCREFTIDKPIATERALACRARDGWRVVLAARESRAGTPEDFTAAAEAASPAFDAYIDRLMIDAPLSASEEAILIGRGWTAH